MADANLAQALRAIRRRTRLSQRALRELSGVSFSMIQLIEDNGRRTDKPVKASPQTLKALARGAATDPEDAGVIDEERARSYYRQLMQAAGYLEASPGAPPLDGLDPEIAKSIDELARRLPTLPADDQSFVGNALRMLAELVARGRVEPGGAT